jgi:heme oxygenase (biliverdin-IX-beta and delta-forming)
MSDKGGKAIINTSFLQQLRDATASQHASLEALPLSKILMDENVTLTKYGFYLQCMREVIAFYNNIVRPLIDDIVPHISSCARLSSLTGDLVYLEQKQIKAGTVIPLQTPEIPGKAFALGIAYVIEGSTLGGRVILKHISPKLNITETQGATFFAGYGHETGIRWKQFLENLTSFAKQQECESQIIEGAIAGFDMIFEHFLKNSKRSE